MIVYGSMATCHVMGYLLWVTFLGFSEYEQPMEVKNSSLQRMGSSESTDSGILLVFYHVSALWGAVLGICWNMGFHLETQFGELR